jgi:hypothetical protein
MWPSMPMGKPSQSHFFQMSMFMCFINLYHVQHFRMDKIYQRGIFTKKNFFLLFPFPIFLQILPGDFGRVFPQTVTYCLVD